MSKQPLVVSAPGYKVRNYEWGVVLQNLRNQINLTQKELAQIIGVSEQSIYYWENGLTYPKPEVFKKLLEIYVEKGAFSSDKEFEEAYQLWEQIRKLSPRFKGSFDREWFNNILTAKKRPFALAEITHHTPNNLPGRQTSFVGRQKDLTELTLRLIGAAEQTMPSGRLVTLTGVGGTGKTSLGLQIARQVLDKYPEGVWWVELAGLTSADYLLEQIATTLGLKEQADIGLLTTLINYLKEKQLLLVLDNCEHLVEECARIVDSLLRNCPGLVVLTTSREVLKVGGELVFQVPSLTLPPENYISHLPPNHRGQRNLAEVEELMKYEAVELLVERGKSANPHFGLNEQNKAVMIQLCRRLDGIPLALELAAARLRVLSVFELSERLTDRFRLLKSGADRTVLPRHQTLRATIDWSYELLSEPERLLFRRLSVFADGFSLQAAEEICALEGLEAEEILDLLHELINKSLVIVEETSEKSSLLDQSINSPLRFKLLETLREYAWEQLSRAGQAESTAVQDCHLTFFTKLAEQIKPMLYQPEAKTGLEQLEIEHDNLRRALSWCLRARETTRELESQTSQTELKERTAQGLKMVAAIVQFWETRSYFKEGQEFSEKLIGQAEYLKLEPTGDLTNVAIGAGILNAYQNKYQHASELFKKSMKLASELGDKKRVGIGLINLSNLAGSQGDYLRAYEYLKQSLVIQQELGYKPGISATLSNLGMVTFAQGDYLLAQRYTQQSLVIAREIGEEMAIAMSLSNLGLGP